MKITFDPDNSEVAIADGKVKDFVKEILERGEDVIISNETIIDELRITALGVFRDNRVFDVIIVVPGNIEIVIDINGILILANGDVPKQPYITPNSERMDKLISLIKSAREKLHHFVDNTWVKKELIQ